MIISAMNNFFLGAKRIFTNGKPLTIITYHSISDRSDPNSISPKDFLQQAEFISKNYNISRLKQTKDILSVNNNNDNRTVIFTFDDAYLDFYETAYPILEKLSIPSTVFIPSWYIGKYNEWDLHLDKYIKRPIMTSKQLIDLKKQGMVDFGSHTAHHISMTKSSISEMEKEVKESRKELENIFGSPITMFSYPFGHFSKITRRVLLESRYDIAVTSRWGTLNTSDNLLNLKRIFLSRSDTHDDIRAKIDGLREIDYVIRIGSIFRASRFKNNHAK